MVDHALDEGSVVDHREMRALPDMDLEPRVSEISPAERVAPRDVRIVARRKARDRNIPRGLVFILIVAGHPELRPDDRKHDTAQFWIVEQLVGSLDIEVADNPAEHIVALRERRHIEAKFGERHEIARQAFLERTGVVDLIGGPRPRNEQVAWPIVGRMDEPAGGFVHGQSAETVTEERERTIEEL